MKKVILMVAMVFATSGLVNAKTLDIKAADCTKDAWDFGTETGGGDEEEEYDNTDAYFEYFCNDDGTYKDEWSTIF